MIRIVLNGNQFPTTPKKSASVWTSYAVNDTFTFGVGMSAMDRVYANVNNAGFAPGYARFDAMASYNLHARIIHFLAFPEVLRVEAPCVHCASFSGIAV